MWKRSPPSTSELTGTSTWDPLALDGLGDDGERLVARLTQDLAQLLHAVAVHNDRLPPVKTGPIQFWSNPSGTSAGP